MFSHKFYVSTSTFGPDNPSDTDILAQARKNNVELDLTGCLFRSKSHYAQLLEGPERHIEQLMTAIRSDTRHHDIREWPTTPTDKRHFPDWSMGYARYDRGDDTLAAIGTAEPRPVTEVIDLLKVIYKSDFDRA